jgi:hypothetical protein
MGHYHKPMEGLKARNFIAWAGGSGSDRRPRFEAARNGEACEADTILGQLEGLRPFQGLEFLMAFDLGLRSRSLPPAQAIKSRAFSPAALP